MSGNKSTLDPQQFHDDIKTLFFQLDNKYGRNNIDGIIMIKSMLGIMYLDNPNVHTMFLNKLDEFSKALVKEILKLVTNENKPTKTDPIQKVDSNKIEQKTNSVKEDNIQQQDPDPTTILDIPTIRQSTDTGLMIEVETLTALNGANAGLYSIGTRNRSGTNKALLPKELSTWASKALIFKQHLGKQSFFAKFYKLPEGTYHADTSFQLSSL